MTSRRTPDAVNADNSWLINFITESNKIEGITRNPSAAEIEAHEALIYESGIGVASVINFVSVIAPGKLLRDKSGMNVRVGSYSPPKGGPEILTKLANLIDDECRNMSAWQFHVAYEKLHPFMDGNGRSGRALWLWHHHCFGDPKAAKQLGFLHLFYYETLSGQSAPA